jgi:hypothetical protein
MYLFTRLLILAILIIQLSQKTGHSQIRQPQNDNRFALIIGNSDYKIGPLKNPVNDAYAMALTLERLGFDVLIRLDVKTKDEMKRAIREFGLKLKQGGTGLFYFAGHGLQVKGFNYLIPVHAEIYSEEEVEYEGVDVGFVLAQMESAQNQMNIVILDACRNNPYARSYRSATTGLASINAPTGSIIAYATAPGSTAMDGIGKNGLYTSVLLKQITQEGLKIEEVFKKVRAEVLAGSGGRQVPWESSSLIGDFYFIPPDLNITELSAKSLSDVSTQISEDDLQKNSELTNNNIAAYDEEQEIITFDKYLEETDKLFSPVTGDSKIQDEADLTIKWKGTKDIYWLFVNGKDISKETTNVWAENGKDLEVYHPGTQRTFILEDYLNNCDNQFRPAKIKSGSELIKMPPLWKATPDNGYWLYINGIDISKETTYKWAGKDLKVYHEKTNTTYLLRDFNNNQDNTIRPAEIAK